jgi:alpha-L-arabinofuranosidase
MLCHLTKRIVVIGLCLFSLNPIFAVTVSYDCANPGNAIPRELMGNNIDWLPFGVHYVEASPGPNVPGTYANELIDEMKAMGTPMLRYPGGDLSDSFYWEETIGPNSERKYQRYGTGLPQTDIGPKFGMDEWLHLCETLGAEPVFTLGYWPFDAAAVRWDMDSEYKVVADVGTNGAITPTSDITYDDFSNILLPDAGDKIKIGFYVPSGKSGTYMLKLRERSGWPGVNNGMWTNNYYHYQLDGKTITFSYSTPDYSSTDMDGFTIWGTANCSKSLTVGKHELTVWGDTAWLRVDYLEITKTSYTARFQAEGNFSKIVDPNNDAYVCDATRDDNVHACMPTPNSQIGRKFKITEAPGYYKLYVRERSGLYGYANTCYWDWNTYSYQLDGNTITFTGDPSTVSALDGDGWTYWGTSSCAPQFLEIGEHLLTIGGSSDYLKVDYVEVQSVNHDNSIKRAQAAVAYCNGDVNDTRTIGVDQAGVDWHTISYWAQKRADNGHPASYGVKYWEVGNESEYRFIPNAGSYAAVWPDYHTALHSIDSGLRVSVLSDKPMSAGTSEWGYTLLSNATLKPNINYVHWHPYFPMISDSAGTAEYLYYADMVSGFALQNNITTFRNWFTSLGISTDKVKLVATEYAALIWGSSNTNPMKWMGCMGMADQLGVFTQNGDLVDHACYWEALHWGGFGTLQLTHDSYWQNWGYFTHGNFDVFKQYNNFFGGKTTPVTVTSAPTFYFSGVAADTYNQPANNYPLITAYGSQDGENYYLIVINKSSTAAQPVTINWTGLPAAANKCRVRTIHGSTTYPNYTEINTLGSAVISTSESYLSAIDSSMSYTLEPCSITGFVMAKPAGGNVKWHREAEDIYTVVHDAGTNNSIYVGEKMNYDLKGHVCANDVGDQIVIPFSVKKNGYYTLRVRARCGQQGLPFYYWDQSVYGFTLDGQAVGFNGNSLTVSALDSDGWTYWGDMTRSDYLIAGRHYLTIAVNAVGWAKIDWIEVQEEGVYNFEVENNYQIVTNASGEIGVQDYTYDNGQCLLLRSYGDKVNVNFSLARSGIYDLRFRIRTGITPYSQFLVGYYSYKLDGVSVTPVVDGDTITRTEGYTIWGTVVLSDKSLNAGSHILEVTFNQEYGMLDYLSAVWVGN